MAQQLELQSPVKKEKGIWALTGFDADKIGNLLAKKHEGDVFIPECKNGETWGARDLLRLDAWVLKRTYSPLTTIGYEIKVSRSDFEQDQKWVGYLDLCHYFYFVCPGGLIRSTDLPQGVGLIWVSSTGNLHTKVKAERRKPDPEKQNGLLIYALMARSKIVANMYEINSQPEPVDKLQQYRHWVEMAEENKALARFVTGHVNKIWQEINKKEASFNSREDWIKRFEERLAKLGITWDSKSQYWADNNQVERQIDLLKENIDWRTINQMEATAENLTKTVELLKKYQSNLILENRGQK